MGSGNRIGRSRGYHSYYSDSRFARAGCLGYCATSFTSFGTFLLFAGGGLMIFACVSDEMGDRFDKFRERQNTNSNGFFGSTFQNTNDEEREDKNSDSSRYLYTRMMM